MSLHDGRILMTGCTGGLSVPLPPRHTAWRGGVRGGGSCTWGAGSASIAAPHPRPLPTASLRSAGGGERREHACRPQMTIGGDA